MADKIEIRDAIASVCVSTLKQALTGDSPEDQKILIQRKIEQYEKQHNCVYRIKWFRFYESRSGELASQPIQEALDYCKNNKRKINFHFIKSIDRFTRAGSPVYLSLQSLFARLGVQLIDSYGVISNTKINTLEHLNLEYSWSVFSPSRTTEILEAERGHSEVRDILTRLIGAEARYVRQGYSVRPAPFGLKNIKIDTPFGKRTTRAPADNEEPFWIKKMYELRIQGNHKDEEIVDIVNQLGYVSRTANKRDPSNKLLVIGVKPGVKLTVKQMRLYLQNTVYAGINTEKWTEGKAIKMQGYDGLVTIEEFNEANRGKIVIVKEGEEYFVFKNKPADWLLTKKKENPDFPHKQYVLCPICKRALKGSASRSKSGKHIPRYHCSYKHKYWSVNNKLFNETIKKFVSKIRFSDRFRKQFRDVILEEWENRREQARDNSLVFQKQIIQYKQEQKLLTEKIKQVSSDIVIKQLEDEIEELEIKILSATQTRNDSEKNELDIQTIINYCLYYMEHLADLLFHGSNPLSEAAMFGLLFEEPPTYVELESGTPKLALIFKLNEEYSATKTLSVTPQGVEPWLPG